jgi:predicted dehydrogenase
MERLPIAIVGLDSGESVIEEQLLKGDGERLYKIAAVCDSDTERLREVCNKYGAKPYNDLGILLTDREVEAVGLFTGPVGRAASIQKIIRARKDVITNNPLDLDPHRTTRVLEEARTSGRVVHLDSPCPQVTADLQQMAFWQRRFDLGKPLNARSENWAPPDKSIEGKWYENPRRCPIIPILRLGVCAINDLVRIFGPGEAVQMLQAKQFTKFPTPDHACATIRFRGGGIGSVSTSFCMGLPDAHRPSLIVNYQNGSIIRKGSLTRNGKVEMALRRPRKGAEPLVKHAAFSPAECSGYHQWETFYQATRGQANPDEKIGEQIVAGVKILGALARSQASGRIEML